MCSYRRKSPILVAFAAAAALLLLPAAGAVADPRDDKDRIDAEVAAASSILEGATERAQEAARQLAEIKVKLPAAEQLVTDARGEVVAARVRAQTARRQAAAAQAAFTAAEQRLAAADRKLRESQGRVAEIAAAAYKGSGLANLNVMMGAGTPSEVLDRFGYVDRVVAEERASISGYLDAVASARREANEAATARAAADDAVLAAQAALDRAAEAETRAEDAAREVSELVQQREAALSVAEQEREASLARYEEAKAEAARIEAALREWEAARKAAAAQAELQAGGLLTPLQGEKTSDFGNRFDPYYKVWQMHAGVDLAADGGTPIHAAAAGEVIMAGWNGGYGNYTCISHGRTGGKALSTCYGHQSKILVHEGQKVERGETIGRVGSTGASTGDHLHFEVRLDGKPVEPLTWLPKCLC